MQPVSNQLFDWFAVYEKTISKHLHLITEVLIISGLLHDFCYICVRKTNISLKNIEHYDKS